MIIIIIIIIIILLLLLLFVDGQLLLAQEYEDMKFIFKKLLEQYDKLMKINVENNFILVSSRNQRFKYWKIIKVGLEDVKNLSIWR